MNAILQFEAKYPSEAGQLYSFLATIFFFLLQAFAKLFKGRVHYSQLAFIRGFCIFLMIFIVARGQKIPLYPKAKVWMMSLRNFVGFQVTIGLFYGVTKIPMSQNVMLLQLSQMAIPLIDRILYKSTYTLQEVILSMVAVSGVYMVLNGKEQPPDDRVYVEGLEKVFVVFVLLLSITFGYSLGAVLVKEFKEEHSLVVVNANFGIVGMAASAILQILYDKFEISFTDFLTANLLVGLSGCLSQTFFLRAYTLAKPGKAALFNCLNVIYAFLVEVTILDEYPTLIQIFGASLTIACIIYSIMLRN